MLFRELGYGAPGSGGCSFRRQQDAISVMAGTRQETIKLSPVILSVIKAAVTIALIAFIFAKIDFSSLARHLDGPGTAHLLLGTLLLMANVLIVAVRWLLLLRRLGVDTVSPGYAMAGTYAATFVGQALPGAIGADAVRGWLCYRRGARLRSVIMSLVTDRLLAVLGLIIVAGAMGFFRFDSVGHGPYRGTAILGAIAVAAAAIAAWMMPMLSHRLVALWRPFRAVHELLDIFRFTAFSRAGALGLLLSCLVIALTVNVVLLFARGFAIPLPPSVAYLVVPAAILLGALPISIGGWGVREASLSYGLTLFGVAPSDAALLGLTLGIGILLASLPGGIVMLVMGNDVRRTLRRTGDVPVDGVVNKGLGARLRAPVDYARLPAKESPE
jgi:glycosyltransferase 2 family protein